MVDKDIYGKTIKFWNSAPCGTMRMPALVNSKNMYRYFIRFDKFFYNYYPYLKNFLDPESIKGKTILEIGLGSGSTLQLESAYAKKVYGMDISDKTVELNQMRKEYFQLDNLEFICGSATKIPLANHTVDMVITIGCIHHIPDIDKVISEIHRVLKPNGVIKGMVYYKDSFRYRFYIPKIRRTESYWKKKTVQECVNELYDGKGNPYAMVYSKADMKKILKKFDDYKFFVNNFEPCEFFCPKLFSKIPRNLWLSTIARVMGTDLYFIARKKR